ncbi:MAG: small subunit ribosomal protein S13 [Bacteroidia bacterium]|jgi:small subunit ribosomal protein S13
MARISGIDLPKNKRGEIGLTYIFGIGKVTAQKILDATGINRSVKVEEWDDDQLSRIRETIQQIKTEGTLRSEIQTNIKRLMDIGAYRGIRHRAGLPLRGQRTKNNSRTRKGKRKTVANKKIAAK